jgi:hypothetical protein
MFFYILFSMLTAAANVDLSQSKLHIIGDSQACSVKPHAPKDAIVSCQVGSTTAQWVKKIDTVGIVTGDKVIVFIGSNDWGGKPSIKPLLMKLVGTSCVVAGPPLIRGKNGAADVLKRDVEADGTCRYLDSRTLNLSQPDGVHTGESKRWLAMALRLLLLSSHE